MDRQSDPKRISRRGSCTSGIKKTHVKMKKRLLLLLLLLGPLGAAAQGRFATKSPDAAREMALRSGKLVLIDV